jgi:hypothetical protein
MDRERFTSIVLLIADIVFNTLGVVIVLILAGYIAFIAFVFGAECATNPECIEILGSLNWREKDG